MLPIEPRNLVRGQVSLATKNELRDAMEKRSPLLVTTPAAESFLSS